jgi:hypothetical protein
MVANLSPGFATSVEIFLTLYLHFVPRGQRELKMASRAYSLIAEAVMCPLLISAR